MDKDSLDFNFGSTGDIFGDFKPDLSSIQKQDDEPAEEVQVKEIEVKEDLEEIQEKEVEDEDSAEDQVDSDSDEDSSDNSEDNFTDEDIENVSYKAIADYLAESGIVDSLDGYEGDDSPEALEMAVSNTIKNMVQHYKDSIPEEGKQFLDYIEKGGDPSKFFQSLEKPIDFNNVDLTKEDNQKQILREFLRSQDYSQEEIEEEINDAEDNLLLEKKAGVAVKKLQKIYEQKHKDLLESQERQLKEQQEQYNEYIGTIHKTIDSSSEIAGLTMTPSEKAEFKKYLLNADSEGLTQYQKELNDNPIQTQLELAYLKFKKYDFSKVSKKVKTEETRRIKNLIKNTDKVNSRSPQITGSSEKGDLSAFKSSLFN